MSGSRLRISEVFFSLQGEASRSGLPTVFIRLTGCPLRCSYCDTDYAFQGGEWRAIADLVTECGRHPTRHITVTGGEPLAQKACLLLLTALCDAGFDVSLETSGALDIASVDPRVARIVDIKTPASGEVDRNLWTNLDLLTPRDEIKLVLVDENDYLWAREQIVKRHLPSRCPVMLSTAWGQLDPAHLATWILRDGLDVRLQIQLHKLLWDNAQGK